MTAPRSVQDRHAGLGGLSGSRGRPRTLQPGVPGDLVVWSLDEVAFAGVHTDLVEGFLRCGPVRARDTTSMAESRQRRSSSVGQAPETPLAAHRRISREWQGP